MFVDERAGAHDLYAFVSRDAEQMAIAADDQPRASGDGASEELVVIRILTNRPRQWRCAEDVGFGGEERENPLEVDRRELRGEAFGNLDVLLKDLGGDTQV